MCIRDRATGWWTWGSQAASVALKPVGSSIIAKASFGGVIGIVSGWLLGMSSSVSDSDSDLVWPCRAEPVSISNKQAKRTIGRIEHGTMANSRLRTLVI